MGCSSIPSSLRDGTPYKGPPDGRTLCSQIAKRSNSNSTAILASGVAISLLATGLLIVAGTLGPDTREDANWAQRNQNLLLASVAGVLGVPATVLLSRAGSTSNTSKDAILQMRIADDPATEVAHDRAAYNRCIEALAISIGGKSDLAPSAKGAMGRIGADKGQSAETQTDKPQDDKPDKPSPSSTPEVEPKPGPK